MNIKVRNTLNGGNLTLRLFMQNWILPEGKTLSRGTLTHNSIACCRTNYGTTNKTNVINHNMNKDTNCHYSVHRICSSETCNKIQIWNFNSTVIGMRHACAQKTEWVGFAVKCLHILYPHNIKTRRVSLRSVCMNVDMASGGCCMRLHWMVPCKSSIEQCSLQYQFSKVGSEHACHLATNGWGHQLVSSLLSFTCVCPFVLLQYPLKAVWHEDILKQKRNGITTSSIYIYTRFSPYGSA